VTVRRREVQGLSGSGFDMLALAVCRDGELMSGDRGVQAGAASKDSCTVRGCKHPTSIYPSSSPINIILIIYRNQITNVTVVIITAALLAK